MITGTKVKTIRNICSEFGCPKYIISDKDSQFVSEQFSTD